MKNKKRTLSKPNKSYANGGGVDEVTAFENKIKDLLKKENQWHFVNETVNGKQVKMKFFVGKKEVDVQIFIIDNMGTRMPRNYSSKRDTLNMIMDNFKKEYANGGSINGKYLDTTSDDKKSKILKNIANHYGISVEDAAAEVKDADAEMLYEYIANDQSLRMDVYNDFKRNKYTKGGGVGEIKVGDFVKKKGSNLSLKVLEISHDKNDGKDYITIYNDVLDYTQKVNNISDYELVKYANGGGVGCGCSHKTYKTGGSIKDQYKGLPESALWADWTVSQRRHFLTDHEGRINEIHEKEGNTNTEINAYEWATYLYFELPTAIKEALKEHKSEGQYAQGGHVGKGELVWRKLSSSEKINFLYENFTPQITPRSQEILVGKAYNFLPKNVKIKLEAKYANVEEYAKGGGVGEVEELWNGYASAVLFSETDSDTEESLDSNYSISDFDEKTIKSSKDLLRKFYSENKEAISESGLSLSSIGGDIWYARAGHGVGFFDRNLDKDVEEKLTKGAKALGEMPDVETYDGKISIRGGRVFKYATGGSVGGKKKFIKKVKSMHKAIDEVILKDGTHIKGKELMKKGGKVKDIEADTDLMTDVIAQGISENSAANLMKTELDKWADLNAEERKKLDEKYLSKVAEISDYLVRRANSTYEHNDDFRKKVNGSGNKGRDYLYMFMKHWAGFHEDKYVGDVNRAMANYNKGMENYSKSNKKLATGGKIKSVYANNGDLRNDWAKHQSADEIKISREHDADVNEDYPYILTINDSSYFYANQKERNEDYDIAKKILKKLATGGKIKKLKKFKK